MKSPSKLSIFLCVVTAHLAILAFVFPQLQDPGSPVTSSAGHDSEHDHDHDHDAHSVVAPRASTASLTDLPTPGLMPTSETASGANPAIEPAKATREASESADELERHRQQHREDGNEHDHDDESTPPHPESIATGSPRPAGQATDAEGEGEDENSTAQLADSQHDDSIVAEDKTADHRHLKPVGTNITEPTPGAALEPAPARPKPVQMIIPETPSQVSDPAPAAPAKVVPSIKPVTPTQSRPPVARPVAVTDAPSTPTAGSQRMRNLRPLKP